MSFIHNALLVVVFLFIFSFLSDIAKAVRIVDDSTIVLYWTAPGDDSNSGTAANYDLRFSSTPPASDTVLWWNRSRQVLSEPHPSLAGLRDSCIVSGVSIFEVNYFALITFDDAGNISNLSNIAVFPILDCGDVNGDGAFNLADPTYLLSYIYYAGLEPVGVSGDIDRSGDIDLVDALILLRYLNLEGPPPNCPDHN